MHRIPLLLTVAALLLMPATAHAQSLADYDYENLTFRGIGLDYGFIWPNKVEPTPVFSLRLDLGYLGPAVRITPVLSYWNSHLRARELERMADRLSNLPVLLDKGVVLTAADLGRVEWSDLVFGIDSHLVWTAPLEILTFVGVGASLHALNGRGNLIDDTFIEDLLDSTSAGVAILAGVEMQPLDRLRVYGEARYTLASSIRYPSLRIGGAVMLPPRQ
jgi:hypothetical protein